MLHRVAELIEFRISLLHGHCSHFTSQYRSAILFCGKLPGRSFMPTVDIIDRVFSWSRVRHAQLAAPVLAEREQYLAYLLENGVSRPSVRSTACTLMHLVRLLDLHSMRAVHISEIEQASARWSVDPSAHATRLVGPKSIEHFTKAACRWFRFHNSLVENKSDDPLDSCLYEFLDFQREKRLSTATIRSGRAVISDLFSWMRLHGMPLSQMTAGEVEGYMEGKRAAGCKPRTIVGICNRLRSFFLYAELRGWVATAIAHDIHGPRVPRFAAAAQGPAWKDVRRLLKSNDEGSPHPSRSTAMLFLFSIYGLRVSEVAGLVLEDFDWVNETFTVRRAKRGRIQKFPIQFEVGEAILKYLKDERPICTSRYVFVTLRPPFRRVGTQSIQNMVSRRMKMLGVQSKRTGPHSLRHACASQLLRKGMSLREIADFLGHRDLRSVSIYAKLDLRALRKVADFTLMEIL
jgi:integrase/recombinase XerD